MESPGSPHGRQNTPAKRNAGTPQTPPSSRRTRSQAAPDWTVQETLILVGEVAAVTDGWLKALSSYQKWKMISDNCGALDVHRSSNQCKRRWELLLDDYQKIKDWEARAGGGSYWAMDSDQRKQYDLPESFDEEVFGSLDAVISTQEDQPVSPVSGGSESEELIGDADVDMLDVVYSDSGLKEQARNKTRKDTNAVRGTANKLRESAELVHAILKGELPDDTNGTRALVDLTKPDAIETEFIRRQADELIKALGEMVGTLNQFTELVKDDKCEEIRPTN